MQLVTSDAECLSTNLTDIGKNQVGVIKAQ